MKKLLKIIFNIISFLIIWFTQCVIIMLIIVGLGLSDLTRPSGYIGMGCLISIYTSYIILKKINNFEKIKRFFS